MDNIIEFMKGKKTYIISAVAIVYALSAFATGNMDANAAFETILIALGGSAIRNGISQPKKQ